MSLSTATNFNTFSISIVSESYNWIKRLTENDRRRRVIARIVMYPLQSPSQPEARLYSVHFQMKVVKLIKEEILLVVPGWLD